MSEHFHLNVVSTWLQSLKSKKHLTKATVELSLKAHICQICKADFSSDWSKQKPEHWLMAKAITNKVPQTVRLPFILSAEFDADNWKLKMGDFTT